MKAGKLDNRGGLPDPLQSHFKFAVNDKRFVYCRIRKNGCSAIQQFIVKTSPHRESDRGGGFAFLRRHHAVRSKKALISADHRILVFRDPVDRIRSLFVNKFIQRRAFADIFKSFKAVTGMDPETVTFPDFVLNYVSRLGEVPLDPHVWPQHWHLCNIVYDLVFPLCDMSEKMAEIVGPELAKQYFQEKVNPSPEIELDVDANMRSRLSEIYAEDFRMIERIN